jgi:hypothetical protein
MKMIEKEKLFGMKALLMLDDLEKNDTHRKVLN